MSLTVREFLYAKGVLNKWDLDYVKYHQAKRGYKIQKIEQWTSEVVFKLLLENDITGLQQLSKEVIQYEAQMKKKKSKKN
jgi:hypothetical protein